MEELPIPCAIVSQSAGAALLALAGYVLGYAAMVDYYGAGVLMVLVFHLFRGRDWKNRLDFGSKSNHWWR